MATNWHQKNKARCKAYGAKWRKKNAAHMTAYRKKTQVKRSYQEWIRGIKKKYGITPEQYQKMMDLQGGVCAICQTPPKTRRLDTDHDHETGRVRGLLCWWCNKRLVVSRHSIKRLLAAVEYLKRDFDGRKL